MKSKLLFTCGAIALLSTTAPQLKAVDAEVKADVDLPKTENRIKRDRDLDATVRTDRTDIDRDTAKVHHSNKASGLLGMEVRNRDNQKLGEIKDLVLESPSKVSYAVLAVGGFLGLGEKLIALPPNAFHVADDGNYLVLDADKNKIQAAPGFPATAWPSPNDPEFAKFWTSKNDTRGLGAPATTERNRRSDLDVDVDRTRKGVKSEINVDTDRKQKIYTDADRDKKVKIEVDKD